MKMNLILIILLAFAGFSCRQQNKSENNTNQYIQIFEQVWNIVNDNFYDPDFNGVDWNKTHSEYRDQIQNFKNTDTLFSFLNSMLFELNSSHCGVGLLSDIEKIVSPYLFSSGEIGIDVRIIESQIVITDVTKNSVAEKAGLRTGFVIEKINGLSFTEIEKNVKYKPPFNDRNIKFHHTIEVLGHIYGKAGTTFKIDFSDANNQLKTKTLIRTERQNGISLGGGLPPAFLKSESYFITVDIGYLTFNAFNPADMEHVLNNFQKIDKSKGLIIDLRGNDGGSIDGMKLLLGRFVSEKKKYVTYINRNEQIEDFIVPVGKKYQGEIVVLIDEMSISGAENMSGIIQLLNIGKVIGMSTSGQMLWGNGYLINDSIALAIPIYKLEYPNGFNPENNGITPDIEVELQREDLLKGKDTQLEKAIEYLKEQI